MADGVASWDATFFLVELMLARIRADIAALRGDLGSRVTRLEGLTSDIAILTTDVATLKAHGETLTFAFAGSPVAGWMIHVPLTANLSVPAGLAGTRYINGSNPLATSVFTLDRQASGTTPWTEIGRITKPAGTAAYQLAGMGSSILAPGDTLRLTALTVGGSLADVGITIPVARR